MKRQAAQGQWKTPPNLWFTADEEEAALMKEFDTLLGGDGMSPDELLRDVSSIDFPSVDLDRRTEEKARTASLDFDTFFRNEASLLSTSHVPSDSSSSLLVPSSSSTYKNLGGSSSSNGWGGPPPPEAPMQFRARPMSPILVTKSEFSTGAAATAAPPPPPKSRSRRKKSTSAASPSSINEESATRPRAGKLEKSRESARNRRMHRMLEIETLEAEMGELSFVMQYLMASTAQLGSDEPYGALGARVNATEIATKSKQKALATILAGAPKARKNVTKKTPDKMLQHHIPVAHWAEQAGGGGPATMMAAAASSSNTSPSSSDSIHIASLLGTRRECNSISVDRRQPIVRFAGDSVLCATRRLFDDVIPIALLTTSVMDMKLGAGAVRALQDCAKRKRGQQAVVTVPPPLVKLGLSQTQSRHVANLSSEVQRLCRALVLMEQVGEMATRSDWLATENTETMLTHVLDLVNSDQWARLDAWTNRNNEQIQHLKISQTHDSLPTGSSQSGEIGR